MTPEQMRLAAGFASGLAKMKARLEQGFGCELTPDETAGMIWAIKTLRGRGGDRHDPAEPA